MCTHVHQQYVIQYHQFYLHGFVWHSVRSDISGAESLSFLTLHFAAVVKVDKLAPKAEAAKKLFPQATPEGASPFRFPSAAAGLSVDSMCRERGPAP